MDKPTHDRGFESHPILDGNGFKAMPGSIDMYPILVKSLNEIKKIQVVKWGTQKNI